MTMQVNKAGTDWLLLKSEINSRIAGLHRDMEASLAPEEYHALRGGIAFARRLIEWVEPTTPPVQVEDDYGMSDPE
jgi:hypothetical protein